MVKSPPASAGDIRDLGSIPGSGRPPGGEHGNPLQYSCLGILMDRKAWRAIVYRVTKSQTAEHASTESSYLLTAQHNMCQASSYGLSHFNSSDTYSDTGYYYHPQFTKE